MTTPRIVLAGHSSKLRGLSWETEETLRIGRQGNMDIILHDPSIGKRHAEVCKASNGWVVRDLANHNSNPTLVNGLQLRGAETQLSLHDVISIGRLKIKVSQIELGVDTPVVVNCDRAQSVPAQGNDIRTSAGFIRVEASANHSWDQSLQQIVGDPVYQDRQSEHLLTLLRTGHHLTHISSLDELLKSILKDAIRAMGAQRGAIVLADQDQQLHLRAMLAPDLSPRNVGLGYSRTLAQRSFSQNESLLCQDSKMESTLLDAASVRRGSMMSMICAVLRSPRHRLGVLHVDRGPFQEPFTRHDLYLADAVAASAAVGIESAMVLERQREEFVEAVTSLAQTVEMRDQYTGDHTRRVTDYSLLLGREMRLDTDELHQIEIGTPLHDIGKIGVADNILRKPGRLSNCEFEQMKSHTVKGAGIIQTMNSLIPMLPIVRHHHERWDGRGYPDGLAGEQIPITARIVAVADAFDAMTSDRPYRRALPAEVAFAELQKNAGTHFDPGCVSAFLSLRPNIESNLPPEMAAS